MNQFFNDININIQQEGNALVFEHQADCRCRCCRAYLLMRKHANKIYSEMKERGEFD